MFIRFLFLLFVFVILFYFLTINETEIVHASTPTPSPPTVSDSPDPQQGGGVVTFYCSDCSAAAGETIKLFVCKSDDARCILESEWSYKVPITISNTGNSNSLTDYQTLVIIDTNSLISAGKMNENCSDIRFTLEKSYSTVLEHKEPSTSNSWYWYNQIIIEDVNNDDENEIVGVGTNQNYQPQRGFLAIYNEKGEKEEYMDWNLTSVGVYAEDMGIYDIDGDNYKEIIVVGWDENSPNRGYIKTFQWNGTNLKEENSIWYSDSVNIKFYHISIFDFDNDGEREILISGSKGNDAGFWVFNSSLSLEHDYSFSTSASGVEDARYVGKMNGKAVVVGVASQCIPNKVFIRLINSSGDIVDSLDIQDAVNYWLPLHIADVDDIDNDGNEELVISVSGNYTQSNLKDAKLFLINESLEIEWSEFLSQDPQLDDTAGEPNIFDFDNDGEKEISVPVDLAENWCGSSNKHGAYFFILNKNGNIEFKREIPHPISDGFLRYGKVREDLNNNGYMEVPLAGSYTKDYAYFIIFEFLEEEKIPYWIESGCNTTNTSIWIKVPFIPANDDAIVYVYYGNENASSESNRTTVFECFSSFENTFDGWTPSKYETITDYSTNDPTITTDWKYDGSYSVRLHIGGDHSDIGAYSQIERTFTFLSSVNVSFFYRLHAGSGADGGDRANFRILVDNDVIYDSGQFGPANWDSGTLFRNFTVSSGTHTITFRLVETASGGGWTDHRYAFLDRIVIRKYTYPEPTVSIGSEQSTDSSSYLWTKSSTAVSSNPSATYTCPSCTYSTNTYYGVTYSVEEGVWTSFTSSQTFTCKKENTCLCSEDAECYSGACKVDPDSSGAFCCNTNQCSHDGSCSTVVELTVVGANACIEGENIGHNSAGISHSRYAAYDGQLYYCGTDNNDKSPYSQVTNLIPGDSIGKCRCRFDGNFDCSSVFVIKGWKSRFRILPT